MKNLALLLIAVILLGSCGTTRIIATHPQADIYVNNVKKGQGEVSLKRMGPPQKAVVYAKYEGEKSDEKRIKREFDLATLIIGMYSYGLGLVLAWRYPNEVLLHTGPPQEISTQLDNKPSQPISPWQLPPRTWGGEQ
jgi:hypothetical protein